MVPAATAQLCCWCSKLLCGGEAVEAELPFPDHVGRLDRGIRKMKRFGPLRQAGNLFYGAMILPKYASCRTVMVFPAMVNLRIT